MNHDLAVQRLASRVASGLAIPAWGGFVFTLFQRPHPVAFADAWMPEVGFVTIATLICGLLSLLRAGSTLSDDISSVSGWLFALFCALPFFGTLWLLDPVGMTPTY